MNDIVIDVIPVEYIKAAHITFVGGDNGHIDLTDNYLPLKRVVEKIRDDYQEDVLKLDLQLNIDKLKHEVSSETLRFMIQY